MHFWIQEEKTVKRKRMRMRRIKSHRVLDLERYLRDLVAQFLHLWLRTLRCR